MSPEQKREGRVAAAMRWFFAEWRFPALVLFVLVAWELMLLSILLVPPGDGALSTFAREFKVWCLGYDPSMGEFQPMYLILMLTEPVALTATVLLVWWRPLRTVLRTPRLLVPWAAGAFTFTVTAALALGAVAMPAQETGPPAFPGERLRTAYEPPQFLLTDHIGEPVSLEALRGQVVVLTGVYATCTFTCPMILGQSRRVIDRLPEHLRDDVTVVAITLDPENDDRERLSGMAEGQDVSWPRFRLANGDPDEVNRVLDQLQIARKRHEATGFIDHANLFVLVDRTGKLAYRFTLGEQQEAWMDEALLQLLAETRPAG